MLLCNKGGGEAVEFGVKMSIRNLYLNIKGKREMKRRENWKVKNE